MQKTAAIIGGGLAGLMAAEASIFAHNPKGAPNADHLKGSIPQEEQIWQAVILDVLRVCFLSC